jgi:hypothetical protein
VAKNILAEGLAANAYRCDGVSRPVKQEPAELLNTTKGDLLHTGEKDILLMQNTKGLQSKDIA